MKEELFASSSKKVSHFKFAAEVPVKRSAWKKVTAAESPPPTPTTPEGRPSQEMWGKISCFDMFSGARDEHSLLPVRL